LHVRRSDALCRDLEGEEFDDLEQAHREAVCSARELAAEAVSNNETIRGQIEVEDEDGQIRATARLRDAINLES
jgi:hypothetical protein